jgi:hypothetical protein
VNALVTTWTESDRTGATPSERRGPVASAARLALLAAIPLACFWWPIGTVPAAGRVTMSDAVLFALWLLSAWEVLVRGTSSMGPKAFELIALVIAVGVLAGIGAALSGSETHATFEFALFMKRFGLAGILPFAALLFRSRWMGAGVRVVTFAAVAAHTLFVLDPALQSHLIRPDDYEDVFLGRATGLLTNPNDLAYSVVALSILHAAAMPWPPRARDRALLLLVLAGAGFCLVSAASRSGLLGSGAAILFLIVASSLHVRTKLALVASAALVVAWGLSSTTVFEKRVSDAYTEGGSEENVSARLDMQWIAARASLDHPFGVGYTGFEDAGSAVSREYHLHGTDSVYFDTLLGAGFLGLLSLLSLFGIGWMHISSEAGQDPRARILHAGVLAFLVFGTAAVVPIAVSSAPLFFSIVASAAFLSDREGEASGAPGPAGAA